MTLHTPNMVNLPPYGYLNIEGRRSVSFIDGNAPWIFIRTGSECLKISQGVSVSVNENYCALVNPFPRAIQVLIGSDMLPLAGPATGWNAETIVNLMSSCAIAKPGVAGSKVGIGVMMKKGGAIVDVLESVSDDFTKVMVFRGADASFLSFKPAGMMGDVVSMRFGNGEPDTSSMVVAGYYTEAMISDWITAAGYSGQITSFNHYSNLNNQLRYWSDESCAVFAVRDEGRSMRLAMRLMHFGKPVEDFR